MHGRLRVWRHVAAAGLARMRFICAGIDHKAGGDRLLEHPLQCDLGQTALGLRIAAADVAVLANKPDLLEVLGPPAGGGLFGIHRLVRKNARRSSIETA